ncbi:sigma-70 family RNA polymerase sigma factor [Dyella sp. C11]|uniref:RNA polymerase sigma factor n=1 Tax=Dyella sp. C11 TaxID=2126991 RepID=UPI001E53F924|nr:sigma-70 family RNA polymerase sigma factor [Dyella sp. C11]
MTADSNAGLAQLFEEQHDTLNRYFLKRTAHAWDAQDLVQELYLRLLRTDRDGTDLIEKPEAYLFTVAANLVKEHAMRKQRSPRTGDEVSEVLERLFTPCDAAAGVDRDLRRQRLAAVIMRLTPKCRAALVMHYRDELGYREIGERLNISTHMVKKYMVKALAVCRVGMARYD